MLGDTSETNSSESFHEHRRGRRAARRAFATKVTFLVFSFPLRRLNATIFMHLSATEKIYFYISLSYDAVSGCMRRNESAKKISQIFCSCLNSFMDFVEKDGKDQTNYSLETFLNAGIAQSGARAYSDREIDMCFSNADGERTKLL